MQYSDKILNQSEHPTNHSFPDWVFKKPENVNKKDLAKAAMIKNGNGYRWCTLCNNGNGAWWFNYYTWHSAWDKFNRGEGGVGKIVRIKQLYVNVSMGKDEEDDDGDDFVSMYMVGDKE